MNHDEEASCIVGGFILFLAAILIWAVWSGNQIESGTGRSVIYKRVR